MSFKNITKEDNRLAPLREASHIRGNPVDKENNKEKELNLSIDQLGVGSLDKLVGPSSGKDTNSVSASASAASTHFTSSPHEDVFLRQHARQEQLKHHFLLVNSLALVTSQTLTRRLKGVFPFKRHLNG